MSQTTQACEGITKLVHCTLECVSFVYFVGRHESCDNYCGSAAVSDGGSFHQQQQYEVGAVQQWLSTSEGLSSATFICVVQFS